MINQIKPKRYVYTYACHEDERELCQLEMRSFLGMNQNESKVESERKIPLNRSPFVKERLDVLLEAESLKRLLQMIKDAEIIETTYKVLFIQNEDQGESGKVGFNERRTIEREIGSTIVGTVDLLNPSILLGVMKHHNRWLLGYYHKSKAIWLTHQKKPNNYSTALSTRLARAIVNIAIPLPNGIKAIDPCCGIGTVLIEALSMDIHIVGRDINPLVLPGARENIAHFGYHTEVILGNICDVSANYDVALIDMPYNLCSVITTQEKLKMIQSARRFAQKAVIVTVEPMDSVVSAAGFEIVDRCVVKKGSFKREILVCE
ncbi:TRM11 family SAM-dependent methyltransferase [Halalkalibacter krulwichiae]|uniref:TRM11 family SAM-dependent methyltransferase n=1 Tax=Halalkalibacter krulwichiae TaxID=199441 RepID=UPI0035300C25